MVGVAGSLIVDDVKLSIRVALDGVELAFVDDDRVAEHLASGALVGVLEDWCPPFPGFFLYYPSRRQLPAALSALIDTLRPAHSLTEVLTRLEFRQPVKQSPRNSARRAMPALRRWTTPGGVAARRPGALRP